MRAFDGENWPQAGERGNAPLKFQDKANERGFGGRYGGRNLLPKFLFMYINGLLDFIGGWGGIRTHDTLARMAVFKTAALNRSATHPTTRPYS